MDKNAIKKYAVWARTELIEKVSQRAAKYGITKENIVAANADSVKGVLLSDVEKKQRAALIRKIDEDGYDQVMEEVAYTWFNRFAALRFMEVNGYLPTHVCVFTDENNAFKPEILSEAIHLDLDGLDKERIYQMKDENKTEELFRYLLIVQCNALNKILPGMFQKIADYTELLLPDNLLREGSVIEQMIALIPEDDWKDQVQIIGWLYQYYNSELKDQVFADLKKNKKITKEKIPAATQLFTPDWIVHYMVENSLGRLWYEGHPNDGLKAKWKYYLDEAPQEPEVETQLKTIRAKYAQLKPEDIRCIDPCEGSGHILCVLFDTLIQIYEDYGYTAREAASMIVQNNIWGLDIDDRAAQLAYFSVMMKARQYDRRFFSRKIQPNVYAIQESNHLDPHVVEYFVDGRNDLKEAMDSLILQLHDAKEYGSILTVSNVNFESLEKRMEEIRRGESLFKDQMEKMIVPLVETGKTLCQQYHICSTNPPYMSNGGMGEKLNIYVKKYYPSTKSDMSTVCMEKALKLVNSTGFVSMINIPVWMFLSSYIDLRQSILQNNSYICMVHPGRGIFGSDFGTTAFIICKQHIPNYCAQYRRLFDKQGDVETVDDREKAFFSKKGCYYSKQENFLLIPEVPLAYWISYNFLKPYAERQSLLGDLAAPCAGLATGNNDIFQRIWTEVDFNTIGFNFSDVSETENESYKWYPCNSGGEFRKWYPADFIVVNWKNNGADIKSYKNASGKLAARPQNTQWYFKTGFTWNKLSASKFAVRYKRKGFIFDDTSRSAFPHDSENLFYYIGLLCSNVAFAYLQALDPTMSFTNGDLKRIPVLFDKKYNKAVESLVKSNIEISKNDWDSFELSWDYKGNPIVEKAKQFHLQSQNLTIKDVYRDVVEDYIKRRSTLKNNEEDINKIFMKIYDLSNEIPYLVDNSDITVSEPNLKRDIKSFVSYSVGCMFGRYSLDSEELIFAGGTWDLSKYTIFPVDVDNIIPICDDEYFEDDIVNRFSDFVKTVYGEENLEENLQFIADALGNKGATSREVIRNYFLNDFFKDHCKTYQKRPIYWLFDSGKKNGFKCLIYMHRYQPDTIARIRTDYLHEQQARYRTAIADLENRIAGAATSDRVNLEKRLARLQGQAEEAHIYEEKIHHLADQMINIDLDDGVKHNYAIFQDVLAKIK